MEQNKRMEILEVEMERLQKLKRIEQRHKSYNNVDQHDDGFVILPDKTTSFITGGVRTGVRLAVTASKYVVATKKVVVKTIRSEVDVIKGKIEIQDAIKAEE